MSDKYQYTLERLLVKSNISIDKEELKLQLQSHPSYPSLHSVTGVLDHFNIPNVAVRLQPAQEILKQLPSHFIALIKEESEDEIVLVEKKKSHIKITKDSKKVEKTSEADFLEKWNGITIAIEKDNAINEISINPLEKIKKVVVPLFLLIALGIFFNYKGDNVYAIVHFISSIVGIGISILIVKEELGFKSEATNNFCNYSEKTSCAEVFNSKGATILNYLKLSDVCLITFSSYLLTWFASIGGSITPEKLFVILSLLSVPAISYSIYYQAKIIKKWCPLCLGIVSVLVIQLGATSFYNWVSLTSISLLSIVTFLISLLLSSSIWNTLKSILLRKVKLEKLEVNHFKFKRNFSVFKSLWQSDQKLTNTNEIKGELTFGNIHAPVELILVTNPYCSFCKSAHTDIERILKVGKDEIKVTLRFRVDTTDRDNGLYKILSEILHVYHTKGQTASLELLNKIYHPKTNLEKWLNQTNIHFNPGYNTIMKSQNDWCEINGINFTPALFLNGYAYPMEYDRTDVIHFIEELKALNEDKKLYDVNKAS